MLYDKLPSALMLLNEQLGEYAINITGFEHTQELAEFVLGAAISYIGGGASFPIFQSVTFVSIRYLEESLSGHCPDSSLECFFTELFYSTALSVVLATASQGTSYIYDRGLAFCFLASASKGLYRVSKKYLKVQEDRMSTIAGFAITKALDEQYEEYYHDIDEYSAYDSIALSLVGMNLAGVVDMLYQTAPQALADKYNEWFGSEGGT